MSRAICPRWRHTVVRIRHGHGADACARRQSPLAGSPPLVNAHRATSRQTRAGVRARRLLQHATGTRAWPVAAGRWPRRGWRGAAGSLVGPARIRTRRCGAVPRQRGAPGLVAAYRRRQPGTGPRRRGGGRGTCSCRRSVVAQVSEPRNENAWDCRFRQGPQFETANLTTVSFHFFPLRNVPFALFIGHVCSVYRFRTRKFFLFRSVRSRRRRGQATWYKGQNECFPY